MPRKAPKKTAAKPLPATSKGKGPAKAKAAAKPVAAPAKAKGIKKAAVEKKPALPARAKASPAPAVKAAKPAVTTRAKTAEKVAPPKPAASPKLPATKPQSAKSKAAAPTAKPVAKKQTPTKPETAKPEPAKAIASTKTASKPATKPTAKAAAKTKPRAKKESAKPQAQASSAESLSLGQALNQVILGDCISGMNRLPEGSVDLVFADPPFNIGYQYDVYQDKRKRAEYLDWSKQWISAVHRALKLDGTFWLAIGDEYAAELKLMAQEIGFTCRSWVIWYYTFGVNCKQKFSRSHAHLFHLVKHPKKFTFRAEAKENRIPSARQLVYNDLRSNPEGRLPDDTWILRPQDLQDCFSSDEDTWYFPRVAGTFKERAGFHGCQMPEQLLGRIIRMCSHRDEIVLDPFGGSGTTLVVAKKLGRQFIGFDISEEYVTRSKERLQQVGIDDPLHGAKEPLMSAPATAAGKRLSDRKKKKKRGTKPAEVMATKVLDVAELGAPATVIDDPVPETSAQAGELRENPLFPGLVDLELSPHKQEPVVAAASVEVASSAPAKAPQEEDDRPHEQYARLLF